MAEDQEAYTAIRLTSGKVLNYVWIFVDGNAVPPRIGGIYPDGATGYHNVADVVEIWGYIPGAHAGSVGAAAPVRP